MMNKNTYLEYEERENCRKPPHEEMKNNERFHSMVPTICAFTYNSVGTWNIEESRDTEVESTPEALLAPVESG